MKILVFSDTHLTDRFEEKKFNFLKKIINQVDQVIINGDFWDGYIISFDKFINSKWQTLFPLLKNKNTIYLFGNHDKKNYSDKRRSLFSTYQTNQYQQNIAGKNYLFEHGDRLAPSFDTLLKTKQESPLAIKAEMIFDWLIRKYRRRFINLAYKRVNKTLKKRVEKLKSKSLFFFGHSHFQEIDLKNNFVNSGLFRSGIAQYLIINNSKIIAKEYWYE